MKWMANLPHPKPASSCLPPHLQELYTILARGLLRLRSRGMPAEHSETADRRDIPLHFTAKQRRHVTPKRKGTA